MGRIVWFGLALAAPAEAVLIGTAVLIGAVAYCAYQIGKDTKENKK